MTRLIGAVVLIFIKPLSKPFFVVYLLCGFSDVLDGFVARRTHSESEFGAKLDSVADLTFYGIMLIKILPILWGMLPGWVWYFVGVALLIRLCSYGTAIVKFRRFASLHTYLNKLTGLMLFIVPLILCTKIAVWYCVTVVVVACAASLQELLIHIFSKNYDPNQKKIKS